MTAVPWPLSGLAMGCDYNPEQWPRETWPEDVRLMREAGVTFATVAVFSWALLEPSEGTFDFGWLDEVLSLLHAGGIAVDLATATASPPPWLSRTYPEILPVDHSGHRLWPGSRQAWCPSTPVFRERALVLVEAMAKRYRDHPALAMWHVSNELGGQNGRCYCDDSAAAFRRWLRARYGSVGRLNDAWGTAFWSHHYGDWDELLDHFRAERDLLNRLSPGVPVTTNFMVSSHFAQADYWTWAPEQDLISQDHYLDGRLSDPTAELSFSADLTRGLAGGRPWFLMEHSTSAVNWQPINYAKTPGQLLRNSLTHVARGADAVGFFQWRASYAGAEQFHSALLPHAGTDTKIWRETVELGAILGRLGDLVGTRVVAEVAVLYDWQARWACDQPNHLSAEVRYVDQPLAVHAALRALGVTTDLIGPASDLSKYRLVVVPGLFLADDAFAAALRSYVEGGGHALVTYGSGIVDPDNHVRLNGYPGAFADLLGIRTEEFYPLAPGQRVGVSLSNGFGEPDDSAWTGSIWTEDTDLRGATALASYTDGPLTGRPVVTRHEFGRGAAWYVGTLLDPGAMHSLFGRVCRDAGTGPVVDLGAGSAAEAVRRRGEQGTFLFVINHGDGPVRVPASGEDLVTGNRVEWLFLLSAGACAIIQEDERHDV